METEFQRRKFSEALFQASALIKVLKSMPGSPWVAYFERLEQALAAQDTEGAVQARDSVPLASMGGFGEFLENHKEVAPAWKELMHLVGDLKLCSRYGVERERHRHGS